MIRALVLASVAACSGFIDDQAAKSTYRILASSQVAARRLPDIELAAAAVPGGIVQLAFALAYPKHAGFRRLHAEAICQYAVGFVFDDWEAAHFAARTDEATRLAARLETLLDICTRANLALLPERWRSAEGDAWIALLPSAKREHATPLLWVASANSVRIALAPMRAMSLLQSTQATLERVVALAPGAHDADAELLLGSLRAGASAFFGGPDGSAQFAAARRALGDGALLVTVLEARGVAVAKKDRERFRRALEGVLAADVTRWPDRRLANELARRKARRYLDAIDTMIPPSPAR